MGQGVWAWMVRLVVVCALVLHAGVSCCSGHLVAVEVDVFCCCNQLYWLYILYSYL